MPAGVALGRGRRGQGTAVVSAGLETGLGRDTQPLGGDRTGLGVISCRSGEGSVPKESPVGTKISFLVFPAPGSGLERERRGFPESWGPQRSGSLGRLQVLAL